MLSHWVSIFSRRSGLTWIPCSLVSWYYIPILLPPVLSDEIFSLVKFFVLSSARSQAPDSCRAIYTTSLTNSPPSLRQNHLLDFRLRPCPAKTTHPFLVGIQLLFISQFCISACASTRNQHRASFTTTSCFSLATNS